MTDRYDINNLINASKANVPMEQQVPILGQQVPVFRGLPVNNMIMSLEDICDLTDAQFRELFMASIISLIGGVYMPADAPEVAPDELAALDDLEEPQ